MRCQLRRPDNKSSYSWYNYTETATLLFMWLAGPLLVGSGVTYWMPGLYLHQERSTCQAPQYCLTLGPNNNIRARQIILEAKITNKYS